VFEKKSIACIVFFFFFLRNHSRIPFINENKHDLNV